MTSPTAAADSAVMSKHYQVFVENEALQHLYMSVNQDAQLPKIKGEEHPCGYARDDIRCQQLLFAISRKNGKEMTRAFDTKSSTALLDILEQKAAGMGIIDAASTFEEFPKFAQFMHFTLTRQEPELLYMTVFSSLVNGDHLYDDIAEDTYQYFQAFYRSFNNNKELQEVADMREKWLALKKDDQSVTIVEPEKSELQMERPEAVQFIESVIGKEECKKVWHSPRAMVDEMNAYIGKTCSAAEGYDRMTREERREICVRLNRATILNRRCIHIPDRMTGETVTRTIRAHVSASHNIVRDIIDFVRKKGTCTVQDFIAAKKTYGCGSDIHESDVYGAVTYTAEVGTPVFMIDDMMTMTPPEQQTVKLPSTFRPPEQINASANRKRGWIRIKKELQKLAPCEMPLLSHSHEGLGDTNKLHAHVCSTNETYAWDVGCGAIFFHIHKNKGRHESLQFHHLCNNCWEKCHGALAVLEEYKMTENTNGEEPRWLHMATDGCVDEGLWAKDALYSGYKSKRWSTGAEPPTPPKKEVMDGKKKKQGKQSKWQKAKARRDGTSTPVSPRYGHHFATTSALNPNAPVFVFQPSTTPGTPPPTYDEVLQEKKNEDQP